MLETLEEFTLAATTADMTFDLIDFLFNIITP
jgi:hypothetical protein